MSNKPPPSNEEKEAESTSSSSGKEGSGGGYSADCSGSDQSLDGNNNESNPQREKDDDDDDDKPTGETALQEDVSVHHKHRKRSSKRKFELEEEGFDVWEGLDEEDIPSGPLQSAAVAATETMQLPYAHWNGIHVTNPMDPRIEFTSMAVATAAYMQHQQNQQLQANKNGQQAPQEQEPSKKQANEVSTVSLESYARLLEAVRPFFFPQGPVMKVPTNQTTANKNNNSSAEQTGTSSEGFTSFFTTTDSNTGTSKSPESSEEDKTKQAPNHGEASSLAVQARPKRRNDHGEQRRVHIQVDDQERQASNEAAIVTDARTSSSGTPQESANEPSSSGNDANAHDGKNESEETPTDQAANEDSAEAFKHHPEDHDQQTDEDQHRKRQDKKRKRIEMRREYEAQQQFESSESSDGHKDKFLRPGKPLALDEAMIFSDIPRILILSHAPFMVVHTNAAFSRLTGIDSHFVVGRPISRLLSWRDEQLFHDKATVGANDSQVKTDPGKSGNHMPFGKFLASCGNGEIQLMKVNTAVDQIVGRSLILNGPSEKGTTADDVRKESSGQHDGAKHMLCKVGIAPIISATNAVALSNYPPTQIRRTNQEQKEASVTAKAPDDQIVSHYVIHLKPEDDPLVFRKGGADSISSASSQTQTGLPELPTGPRDSPSTDSSGMATGLVAAVG